MAKLEASESANNELRGQAQNDLSVREDRRKESRKLATMFNGAMVILGITDGRLTQLVERSSTEASGADAATTKLQKANTVLRDSVRKQNLTIANMSTDLNTLRAAKAQDDSTIARVRGQNADLHDRINYYAETSVDLRAEVDSLTLVKETLAARVSKVQKSSELKSQRLYTLGKEATEKDDKIKSLQDRVAALEAASRKPSTSTQSQTRAPPARNVGLAAWNNFNIADAERQANLLREAASRAAEDAKKGVKHDLVEPTFSTSFKQVTIGPNGERIVRRVVKGGADTAGSADSGPAAESPSAPPPARPLPASTTPTAAGAQPAIPNTSTAGPKTAATQKTVCRDFTTKGSCRFGDSCRFAHVAGQVDDNKADAPAKAIPKPRASGPNNIPKKNIMCPHLLQGECKFGNRCRYAHVATDKTVYSGGLNSSGHKSNLNKAKK